MKKVLKNALLVAFTAGLACAAGAVTKFEAAESVWPAGLAEEMNTLIAFRAPFELKVGERPVLKMVAWYSYRVTLNGAFVGFGPARGPKGFFRPDEWDLSKAAKPGRNELCVEVAGYNVPNFYLMEQPPFFKAEVVCGGDVRAATKRTGGAFAATRQPRVQKVPRYSFQRTFAEAYRLPAPAHPPALALAAAPEPALIERRAPYPDFEVNPRMAPVSFANVRYDETAPVHADRALTLPGTSPTFKGFPLADLELNVTYLAQRLVCSDRRPATDAEKASASFALAAGASMVFDNGLNDTGFPGLRVEVKKPGRLVLQFDEVLSANGEARGIRRYKDCCNALVWDFAAPGVYEVDAFEPYTMRYVELDVVSGEMTVSAPRFRSYKNPTAKRARFRASDPALVAVFDAANETFRQNAVDVFMDCPSRERAGWNCDAYFTAPASTLLTGDFALERVFEENLALPPAFDDIAPGALPMCYPSDHRDRTHIPNWGMWFVLETEEYLRRTGDRTLVDALRPRLEKFVAFLWKYRNADGLLERLPSWVFVEWSRANKLVQDVNYPSNMTWADTLDAMDRLYGRPDFAAEAARVRAEVRRQSWTGTWFCDNAVRQKDGSLKLSGECTETCQYYAFFHRVATPETHPALWKTLLADFGPKRYDPSDRKKMLKHPEIWPSNAFIGNYLRLKLLERAGRGRQILDETKGYFTYMAERTGTLWENDTTSASCNHGFASYAAVLLVHSVLGVEVDHLKKTVTVRPTDVDLDFCGVTLPVPGGEIAYDWVKKGGRREETFAAPPGWRLVHASKAWRPSERWIGVNLPYCLYHKEVRKEARYNEEDFRFAAELGFNFIRLPLDYRCWIKDGDWNEIDDSALDPLNEALAWGRKYGLHVQFCFHRAPGYSVNRWPKETRNLFREKDVLDVCARHWRHFARRWRGIPNERLSFNLFNESPVDPKLAEVERYLIRAIHAEDPFRFIVADGSACGEHPVAELESEQALVGQATRGYSPMSISHCGVSWMGEVGKGLPPRWPMHEFASPLYGLSKAAWRMPLRIQEAPAGRWELLLGQVSSKNRLTVTADGLRVAEWQLDPATNSSDWAEAAYSPKWKRVTATPIAPFRFDLARPVRELAVEVAEGDWVQVRRIAVTAATRTASLQSKPIWGKRVNVRPFVFRGWNEEIPFAEEGMPLSGDAWLESQVFSEWIACAARGNFVMVGECGASGGAPYDVYLRWMEDQLKVYERNGFGFAFWTLRGPYGVLDTGRKGAETIDFHGHRLDKGIMDLVRKYK